MKTHFIICWCIVYLCLGVSRAAVPQDFAVDLQATVSDTAPHISLFWTQRMQPNIYAQKIHRRNKGSATWVKLADLEKTQTGYVDATAEAGTEYEYWMERTFTGLSPYTAVGYLSAGVKVPEVHSRGTLLLVVDDTMAAPLAKEISQLRLDLAGDGWAVQTIIAPRTGTAIGTKALIKAAYDADPAKVKAVYLLGHVPVPYSGYQNPDGHSDHRGAWPADGYYGEMDGKWTDTTVNSTAAAGTRNDNIPGDGKFDLTTFNNLVELQVGRVDLHTMTKAPVSGVTEEALLRRYLKKAHDFRHKQGAYAEIPRRTLIRDGFGHFGNSEPFAVTGWEGALSSVGGTVDEAPYGEWFSGSYAGGKDYLWGYACGPGTYESAASLGTTEDFGKLPSRVVFTSIFGSYHGDWDAGNNLMRAAIAGNADGTSLGLSCFWAGRPHWFPHPLGMGETLGYMTRLTMNAGVTGGGTYRPTSASFGGTHIGLMGDPALRLHVVEPPRELAAISTAGTVYLRWAASGETDLQGYHVYRADTADGPFVKLTAAPITDTGYGDKGGTPDASYVYLVRTLKLESVPGGTYYNLSTGSAVEATVVQEPTVTPENLAAGAIAPGSVPLAWTPSPYAASYRLERRGDDGSVVSISVSGTAAGFTDTMVRSDTGYDYEVVALNIRGESVPATLRVTTPASGGAPGRPAFVTMAEGKNGIVVSWTYSGKGQIAFEIGRRVANGTWMSLAVVEGSAMSYVDDSALPGMLCMYRVRAFHESEISAWATPFSMTQDDTLAITGAVRVQGGVSEVTPGSLGNVALSLRHSAALTPYGLRPAMTRTRNDASGWFGMELRTGASAVEVRELGRFVLEGNTGAHTVRLVDAETGAELAAVVVDTVDTAGAAADAFQYAALPSPVTLAADSRYFLLSEETAGGDAWLDPCVMAPGTATGYQRWLLANGLPMDGSRPGGEMMNMRRAQGADDGGGLPNLVKYALGLSADVSGDGGRMSHGMMTDITGDHLTFTFTHPFPAPEGVSYAIESCPNLDHWTTTNIVLLSETVEGGLRTVTVKVESGNPGRCFARLRVVVE